MSKVFIVKEEEECPFRHTENLYGDTWSECFFDDEIECFFHVSGNFPEDCPLRKEDICISMDRKVED